ncbi:MAG: type IV secretion system DNA-binding domain-containing protein [Proteobacteria bacterium]|nr:type IV secretion system DNA-binding domain-containing protein [Pseudomonadota bacterium]
MALESLLHGWPGLFGAYAAVQAPMVAGLLRARAPMVRALGSPLIAAPLTVLTGAGIAGAEALLHVGATLASTQLALGTAVSAAVGYAAGRALGRTVRHAPVHQRGALVVEEAPAPVRPRRTEGRRAVHEQVSIAGIRLSAEDEVKHFKFIGTTGTGKSTAIHELLETALRRGDRAVIADPDGGYLRRFYRRERGDVILNPFEPASARWDVFGEINDDYDVEQLARSLIPDHEGSDRSWRGYARTFFSAVTAQAHAAGSRDVRELYRLLVVAGTPELRTLVGGTPAQPFLEEHNGRMFDSIRSVTASAVGALDYVSRQTSTPLSVRQWVADQDRHGVLFIPYRAGQVAALRSTISAWMRLAIFEALQKEEGDQRLWFVVDELDALGQIDGLKDALARLRKFGGRCVLGFQSAAQVSSTYGQGEANTLVENCGNTLVLRCSGSEHGGTSQFASRLIGEREVLRTSVSRSRHATQMLSSVTRAEHIGIESAVMPAQIEQLPDLSGYLKIASRPYWQRVRLQPRAAAREEDRQLGRVASLSVPAASPASAAQGLDTGLS